MSSRVRPEQQEFYLQLLLRTYQDAASILDIKSSAQRADMATLRQRTKAEGMSFLTKTLPSLGKALDKSLASDRPFEAPVGFKTSSVHRRFPLLFGDMLKKVFNGDGMLRVTDRWRAMVALTLHEEAPETERSEWLSPLEASGLVAHPSAVRAVRALRQVCYLLYKLEGAHAKADEVRVMKEFVATDQSLLHVEDQMTFSWQTERALENAQLLIWHVLDGVNLEDIIPKHGPGAVATGEKMRDKMKFRRIFASLEKEYPFADYFRFNYTHLVDTLESLEDLEVLEHGTAKVVLVPKDSRGPRLISMEPLEIQWIQQGQMRALVRKIEGHRLSRGYVNFTSQEVNRELARLSSDNGSVVYEVTKGNQRSEYFATVDLKEASDRVSLWLVKRLFPANVYQKLVASRSSHTRLPDGTLLELRKFAPMGSSVCFPVEALIFWALAVGSIQHVGGVPRREDLAPVYVFGDDIILPKGGLEEVRHVFEEVQFLLNEDKCCTGRFFRESCGMDALSGQSVVPIRVSTPWCRNLSPAAVASYVSYTNSLRKAGFHGAADYIRDNGIAAVWKLPTVHSEGISPLAFVDRRASVAECVVALGQQYKHRWNAKLHRFEIRLPTLRTPTETSGEPDWDELFRRLPQMGPPDPFGAGGGTAQPCCFPSTTREKKQFVAWNWQELNKLFG